MTAEEIRTHLRGAQIAIVPYAHCDWAWTHTRAWHERRYVRIFEEVLQLIRSDPDFRWYLDCWITELKPFLDRRPDLLPELQARIREGKIAICGAFSNVRPNMVGEETFLRNLILGRRHFRALFPDADLTVHADIVDVALGHPQMPQVLRLAGYRYFRAWRPQAALTAKGIPYEWTWEGLDGSQILCSRGCYGGFFYDDSLPDDVTADWDRTVEHVWEKEIHQAARLSPTRLLWVSLGCDDALPFRAHNTDKFLDVPGLVREWNRREAAPMRFMTPVEFYRALEERRQQIPIVSGTLDPCDVSYNAAWGGAHGLWRRRIEADRQLTTAELWQTLAPAGPDPNPELRELWEHLLLFCAHATQWLLQDDFDELDSLANDTCRRAATLRRRALEAVARRVPQQEGCAAIVFNHLPHPREVVVPLLLTAATGIPARVRLIDGAGRDVPYQIVNDLTVGPKLWERQAVARVSLPPAGYTTITWVEDRAPQPDNRTPALPEQWTATAQTDDLLRAYLDDLAQIPPLSPQEEADLHSHPVALDPDARQRLIEAHLHLVLQVAADYLGGNLQPLELIQEGNVALIRAVEQFDPAAGYRFATYATWWIRDALTRAIAERASRPPVPPHLHAELQRLARASRHLRDELQREPTLGELAVRLEMSPDQVAALLRLAPDSLAPDSPRRSHTDAPALPARATVERLIHTHRHLYSVLHREPTLAELAAALTLSPQTVTQLLEEARRETLSSPRTEAPLTTSPATGTTRLTNGLLALTFRDGHLVRVESPQGDYPAPAGTAWSLLRLYEIDPDGPLHVGEIRATADVRWYECRVVEQGPVRWRHSAQGRVGHQAVRLETLLFAGEPRAEFRLEVDWQPHDGFLAVLWPIPFNGVLTGDVPFGAEVKDLDCEAYGPIPEPNTGNVERYRDGMFFARSFVSLADGRHGISFVSHDGDRYYIRDRVNATLAHVLVHSIRKVTEGWEKDVNVQEQVAEGRHTFAWSLLFHAGDWRAADVVRQSARLRNPPEVLLPKGAPAPDLPPEMSFLSLEPEHVVLSALYTEGDDVVLRVWEGEGLPAAVAVRLPFAPLTAAPVDLNGEPLAEPPVEVAGNVVRFPLRPWQIATIRMRR